MVQILTDECNFKKRENLFLFLVCRLNQIQFSLTNQSTFLNVYQTIFSFFHLLINRFISTNEDENIIQTRLHLINELRTKGSHRSKISKGISQPNIDNMNLNDFDQFSPLNDKRVVEKGFNHR